MANEGGIFDFGLLFSGSLANNHLNAPIVGLANAPGPAGYLMVGGDGGVFALGGANFFGSLGGQMIPSPIAAIAAPPSENGYWLAAQNGKIYNYGAAPALPAIQLPAGAHIVGMASTTDGQGAWLTDQLGDVYAEGSAHYVGGLGGVHINMPIVGIAAAASGQGYILVASDGGTFAYRDAELLRLGAGLAQAGTEPQCAGRGDRGHALGQRLLGGRLRRWRLHLRRRAVPRLDGRHPPQRPGRRHPAPRVGDRSGLSREGEGRVRRVRVRPPPPTGHVTGGHTTRIRRGMVRE